MIGLVLSMFMLSGPGADDHTPIGTLKSRIENRLAHETGVYAIALKDLQTGEVLYFNERQQMHAASTMKVAVMVEVFRQAQQGRFGLDDSVLIKNQFKSLVDERPFSIDVVQDHDDPLVGRIGRRTTVRDLVFHMITHSSNLATNLLIERTGAKNVQATAHRLGARHLSILRGVEDNEAYKKGLNNRTDAYSLMVLLAAIAQKKAASEKACDEMIDILLQQQYRDKIPALLPAEIKVANKTGSITQINHDAAIVFLPDGRQYILVILSQGIEEQKKSSTVIAEVSLLVYQWFMGKN